MMTRIYIKGLVDFDVTLHELFFIVMGLVVFLWIVVAIKIRSDSIKIFMKERAERRQKLGKVK